MSKPYDLVPGTWNMLLLKILALEPMNDFAVSRLLKQLSDDVLRGPESRITTEWKRPRIAGAKYYSSHAARAAAARKRST